MGPVGGGALVFPDRATGLAALSPAAWTRQQWALAAAATLAVWGLAALAWPLTQSVVPWDSKNQFYPFFRYVGEALAAGELPLWNPYHFSGHPSIADPQSLLFSPSMMLFAWLCPKPSMQLFDVVVLAHLLPGGLAMLGLFARRGWRPEGAVVAGMVFMLGGSASARLQHTGIILGYGFFPLALLMLERMLARRSLLDAVGFGIVATLMVIGRDQVAFLFAFVLIGAVIHRAWTSGQAARFLRERAAVLAVAGLTGAVLLAVPVVLTMQFLMTSTRPSFGFGVAAMGSLPPESFATVLFANVFGSLRWTYDYWGPDWHSLVEGTWTDRATNYLFAGTLPGFLILWHGIAGGRLLAREFRFFLIVGLVAIVYALGRYTPVFSVVFDSLPGVALYRRPADATFQINVVLAFAAGYLVHRFLVDGNPSLATMRRSPLAAVLVAGAIVLGAAALIAGLLFAIRAHETRLAAEDIAAGLAIMAALSALLLWRPARPAWRAALACGLVAFTGAELIGRNAASALNAEPADRYAVFKDLPPDQLRGLQVLRQELADRAAHGDHPRVEILGLGGAWQNASMVLGLEDTLGYNPLRLSDYERAIGPGENAVDPNLRQFPGTFRGYKCRLATLLGLEYLVLDRPAERLPRHFPRLKNPKLLFASGSMYIYRLTPGAARVYLATHVVPVESENVLEQEELPDFDRASAALVEQDQLSELKGHYAPVEDGAEVAAPGTAQITAYGRNAVEITVDSNHDALLVLHDIYYPGWQVTVDGERRPIVRANLLFRGVEVGAGHHVVQFAFRPLSLGNLLAAATDIIEAETGGAATP